MKIGLAQMDIVWENPVENIKKCEYFCNLSKVEGVDVLIFPETVCNGFTNNISSVNNSFQLFYEKMRKFSINYGFTIIYGAISPGNDKAQNQCIAFNPSGKLLWRYTKIHPFSFSKEDLFFESGTELAYANISGVCSSPLICYDLRFPEIFQAASEKAEILIVIANWPTVRIEHWDILLKARAVENQSFVIGVNRTGCGNNLDYCGHSVVINPFGQKMNPLFEDERLIAVEINPTDSVNYRDSFRLKKDRDLKLYSQLYNSMSQKQTD